MIRKVLIANRGEIALRVIRACRDLGLKSVAVYSEADRWANYVAQADESYLLGPAPARESYLRADRILETAKRCGAEAIHPGYGFLAENAEFAAACAKERIRFIGPPAQAIRAVGNKIAARRLAEQVGVPVVPGLSGEVDQAAASAFARQHGYPVLLKAAAGGGGKGMRVVRAEKDLARSLREASSEADSAFGDGAVFLEKLVEKPRHVEIQVVGDARGRLIHLGERECSIQRRHQKLVEESPSVAVDPVLRAKMGETAVRLLKAAGYSNAGTCEFLLNGDGDFHFLEVNTRLQVEHPVTEMVTGLDLVKLQILVAAGERLPLDQGDVHVRGHAMEARVCAEDPFANFAPSTGEITGLRLPAGPHVRVDTDLAPRSTVTPYYDSMIAKVIAWGGDRGEAVQRLVRALREFKVVGVQTTVPFHLRLLADRRFREGKIHTKFLDEEFDLREGRPAHALEAALLAAALEFRRTEAAVPQYHSPRPLGAWRTAFRSDA